MKNYQLFEKYLSQYRHIVNVNLDSYTNGFDNYKESITQIIRNNINTIDKQFEVFAQPYREILIEKHEKNELYAWDFSIFNIIKSRRPEEHIHSPIIFELLDTHGSHGQKDLFYRLFLKTILPENEINKFLNEKHTEYRIKTEEWIKSEIGKGEIDITIKSTNPKKKFAIIIENKWKSPDSCYDQLFKYYYCYTEKYGYSDENLIVVYLTLHGEDPKLIEHPDFSRFIEHNKEKNYFPISYKKHITKWLELCAEQCKSEKVKQLIIQYLNYIKWNQ